MKYLTIPIMEILLLFSACLASAQVSVTDDGSFPHSSAMLEVKSTTRGMLVPRMTTAQRLAITTAANGLLVFDIDKGSFWYFSGTSWQEIRNVSMSVATLSDTDNDTKVMVEKNPDEDLIRFNLSGTERMVIRNNRLELMQGGLNSCVGLNAGQVITTGQNNAFFGYNAGTQNSSGSGNSFFGYLAGASDNQGSFNAFFGSLSGSSNTTGESNVAVGAGSSYANLTGTNNTAIGYNSLYNNIAGNNIAIGSKAAYSNTTGAYNIAIGSGALLNNTDRSGIVAIGDSSLHNNGVGATQEYHAKRNTAVGYQALFSNTTGYLNTAVGYKALYTNTVGKENTAFGREALFENLDGNGNTAVGDYALEHNHYGDYNTATGTYALANNSGYTLDGNNNTANGNCALRYNYAGSFNVALGDSALYNNYNESEIVAVGASAGHFHDGGYNNTFVGFWAGRENTSAHNNTFLGYKAGSLTTTGQANTILGSLAGENNSTGYRNTFVGYKAGDGCESGYHNTIIGYGGGLNMDPGGYGNIFIGYQAGSSETGNNRFVVENDPGDTGPFLWGTMSGDTLIINGTNTTTNPGHRRFFVNGSAGGTTAWYNDSDERFKKNIRPIDSPLEKVEMLRGINFEWIDAENHHPGPQIGFIAQQAEAIVPEVVDCQDGYYAMDYASLTALLVEAVKEQQKTIESQDNRIGELTRRIETLEKAK